MASRRRMGAENSETRNLLIEAAEQLVREEGYAAVTARRLAEKVGLKRQIVHYYFATIEELLITMIRRNGDRTRERLQQLIKSNEPLRAIWEQDGNATVTVFEITALAIRSETIRTEMKCLIEEFRLMQIQALEQHLAQQGIKTTISPTAAVLLIRSLSQSLALDRALGVSVGHAETKAFVEGWLQTFEESGDWLDLAAIS